MIGNRGRKAGAVFLKMPLVKDKALNQKMLSKRKLFRSDSFLVHFRSSLYISSIPTTKGISKILDGDLNARSSVMKKCLRLSVLITYKFTDKTPFPNTNKHVELRLLTTAQNSLGKAAVLMGLVKGSL